MKFTYRSAHTAAYLGVLFSFAFINAYSQQGSSPEEADTSIQISADDGGPHKPLVHFWSNVVGAERANEGLRATWQEELAIAHRYAGFRYVRFQELAAAIAALECAAFEYVVQVLSKRYKIFFRLKHLLKTRSVPVNWIGGLHDRF